MYCLRGSGLNLTSLRKEDLGRFGPAFIRDGVVVPYSRTPYVSARIGYIEEQKRLKKGVQVMGGKGLRGKEQSVRSRPGALRPERVQNRSFFRAKTTTVPLHSMWQIQEGIRS